MRAFRTLSPWVLSSTLLLASCGGSDPDVPGSGSPSGAPTTAGSFTAVVSFGDSLSDVGSYAPATSLAGNGTAPFFAGRFTTNPTTGAPTATPLGKVWVENLAASLGLIVTPAEVGFGSTSVKCPAAAVPALATTCTAYGQGGARVTDPIGIGHSIGALTVPVVTQIANHLARFGSFKNSDLILVYAGSNDVFIQFDAFGVAAAQIQADAARRLITPDRANLELFNAQQVAQAAMKTAAQELVALVKTQILAKGGTYVAVMTLSDIADTPLGNSAAVAPARSVLSDLSGTFNLWLRDGLTGEPVQSSTPARFQGGLRQPAQVRHRQQHDPRLRRRQDQADHRRRGDRRLLAVLQQHAGRALQRPRAPAPTSTPGSSPTACIRRPAATRSSATRSPRSSSPSAGCDAHATRRNSNENRLPRLLVAGAPLAAGARRRAGARERREVRRDPYTTHAKTNGIAGIGVPPGADAETGDATTVIRVYERLLTPNFGAGARDGHPAAHQGAGHRHGRPSSRDDVLSVAQLSRRRCCQLTTSATPGATRRPYVGAGINYTKFKNAKSSIASDVEVGSSWGPAVQVGLEYAITKEISAFASLAAVKVKSKVVASGATVLTTTVDYRPTVYSLGVAYKF